MTRPSPSTQIASLGALLVSLLASACGNGGVTPAPPAYIENDAGAPAEGGTTPAPPPDDFAPLAATIEAERMKLGAPGVAVIVMHRGRVVLSRGFGTRVGSDMPIRTSTLFRISSIAKTWTAVVTMKLIEEGRLAFTTKILDLVPSFTLQASPPEAATLTLQDLLRHESGIYDGVADESALGPKDDGLLERWATSPAFASTFYLMTPPGRTFSYTNVEYSIAGLLLEKASGRHYRDLVREKVFAPLGMSRVLCVPEEIAMDGDFTNGKAGLSIIDPAVDWSPVNYPSGGGSGCHASADDLAKLARFFLEGDLRVLTDVSRAAMRTDPRDTEQPWVVDRYHGARYGIGLEMRDGVVIDGAYHPMRLFGHEGNGKGYAAAMYLAPDQDLAFIALANGSDAYFDDSFAHALKLAGLPPAAPFPPRGVAPAIYPSLVGTYYEPRLLKNVVVRMESGKLVVDASGLSIVARPLNPDHGRRFELPMVQSEPGYYDHYVRFLADPTGKTDYLHNRYWVAKRVD